MSRFHPDRSDLQRAGRNLHHSHHSRRGGISERKLRVVGEKCGRPAATPGRQVIQGDSDPAGEPGIRARGEVAGRWMEHGPSPPGPRRNSLPLLSRTVANLTDSRRQSSVEPTELRHTPSIGNPFQAGAIVLLTLGNPREKFWGAILALTAQGLSLSGIELGSFEDFVSMIKAGDAVSFGVVFFPMHRIERVELDSSDGHIPSLSQRFTAKTGLSPASVLTRDLGAHWPAGGDSK